MGLHCGCGRGIGEKSEQMYYYGPMSQSSVSSLLHATQYQPSTVLPVKDEFVGLMPKGGLVTGTVVAVSGLGSYTAAIEMLSTTSQAGFTVALAALCDLGVMALAQTGWDLSRVVMVDDGPEMAQVIALLIAAFDVVVFEARLIDRHWHRLVARTRERKSALVVVDQDRRIGGHRQRPQVTPDVTLIVEEFGWAEPSRLSPFGAPTLHLLTQEHGLVIGAPTVLTR